MFRRRRETDDLDDEVVDDDAVEDFDGRPESAEAGEYGEDVVHPGVEQTSTPVDHAPTSGPWDFRDRPRDDDMMRVDLGGMRVPIPDGAELRVEAQDEVIVAAALIDGPSQILLHVFAAPKSRGIWDEVRGEIAASLKAAQGSAEDVEGPFGTELKARIPGEGGISQPARFIGADGPRWFLRGLMTGPASTDPTQAKRLEDVFRAVVVNRGAEAMAPRDAIPLHLPREIVESAVTPPEGEPGPRRFELRERGPEITETQ